MSGTYHGIEFKLGTARIKPYDDFSMLFSCQVEAKRRHGSGFVRLERFENPQRATTFRNAINAENN